MEDPFMSRARSRRLPAFLGAGLPAALSLLTLSAATAAPPSTPAAPATPATATTASAPATAATPGKGTSALDSSKAAREIDRATLEAPIRFLADDLLEGRGPATRGDQLSRLYLATTLEGMGLAPGFPDGSWQQPFDLVGVKAEMPATWSFTAGGKTVDLKRTADYIAASGVQEDRSTLKNAELVFVGYGIQAPEYKWDDFKGVDLKGKVLVMLNNDPDWDDSLFAGKTRLFYGRWVYKYESAARQGAAGAIIVHTTPSAGYGWQVVQSSWSGEQFRLPAAGEPQIQVAAWTTEPAMRTLLGAAGQDLDKLVAQARSRDFKPVPLGIRTTFALANKVSKVKTANVAGLLTGSDPKLKSEVVIYSAHHDHLGIGKPDDSGDTIYNGAEDNAAGCAQVLAIAKAFTALPQRPKRSILFLFVAAEEQGLLGSEYYAHHPSYAPGRIAANINYDGGNLWGRAKDVSYIGLGKSSLDGILKAAAARQGRTVVGDEFPDRGHFYRSDQFNFAKIGVPALYLNTGNEFRNRPKGWGKEQIESYEQHEYHQPSDQLTAKWSFDGMIEDAQLGYAVGLTVAQAAKLPTWKPGDEFEAARKKALAAVAGR
jgi:Zn-dependent M28 family amino/carboxypeptidase